VKTTVFVGGGRITSALIAGLRLAKCDLPIIVHDRHSTKLRQLQREYGVVIAPNLHRAVEAADILMIAVRPNSVPELLKEIAPHIRPRLTAISLAAGIPLNKLRGSLGPKVRWARAMPSPVCRAGRGLTALTFGRGLPAGIRSEVRELFELVGTVLEIPEVRFDAFTVTYSSSHGYHALAALIDAAEAIGLDRKTACLAATHALADSISAWHTGDLPLQKLLREASTPGGIAAAVIASLDRGGYRRIVAHGLRAGIEQARRNARL
jgi:pyrroline-5-carboxylate reductase